MLDKGLVVHQASNALLFSMDFSFDSVGKFLQQVQGAKAKKKQVVEDALEPLLSDPDTFAISPVIGKLVDKEVEGYGDEALRQICIVVLGKWIDFHRGFLEEHVQNDAVPEALLTMRDVSILTTAIKLLEQVGSFGGDDDYRQAMHKQINQAVLEQIEEMGKDPEEVFNGEDNEEQFRQFL